MYRNIEGLGSQWPSKGNFKEDREVRAYGDDWKGADPHPLDEADIAIDAMHSESDDDAEEGKPGTSEEDVEEYGRNGRFNDGSKGSGRSAGTNLLLQRPVRR